jgi:hypothetical protein
MKKHLLIATIAVCLLATMGWAASKKVVVEAENCVTITSSMQKTASSLASNGAYIQIPLRRPHATTETGPADTGNATYNVNIPAAGSYRFWGRTHWSDGCGNSFFLRIGTKPAVVLGQDGTYQRWHWVKGPTVQLPAGAVQIVIQNREDGAKIDQFLLTNNLNYVPVRAERATQ